MLRASFPQRAMMAALTSPVAEPEPALGSFPYLGNPHPKKP
jgi:hypothetical protein